MFSNFSKSKGRLKIAITLALLAVILLAGIVAANGHNKPPAPPMGNNWGMKGWGMPPMGWAITVPGPEIEILRVETDSSVTFSTTNLPEDKDFNVTMGPIYSRGVDGVDVGSFNSSDGVEERIYKIPQDLLGQKRIAVRIETEDDHPYFAFNWFYNNDTAASSSSNGTEITVVTEEASTEIESTEGETGTGGADAESSEESEESTAAESSEESQESTDAQTSEESSDQEAAEETVEEASAEQTELVMINDNGLKEVVPSFEVCAVRKDMEVFIDIHDFPPNETFKVQMGLMPHKQEMKPYYDGNMKHPMDDQWSGPPMPGMNNGQYEMPMPMPMPMPKDKVKPHMPPKVWINYYDAGEFEVGEKNGELISLTIPEELAGAYRITILLRSDHAHPYYAYNWFYNNSAVVCGLED